MFQEGKIDSVVNQKDVSDLGNHKNEQRRPEVAELPSQLGEHAEIDKLPNELLGTRDNTKVDVEFKDSAPKNPDILYEANTGKAALQDDNAKTYCQDGKLLANTEYKLNDYKYRTDDKGRMISAEGDIKLENGTRNQAAQLRVGGEYRLPTDQGGHPIARRFGGDGGEGNLVAMDGKLNQGEYARMENTLAAAKADGKDVKLKVEVQYSGNSERPTSFTATYSIDGEVNKRGFSNKAEG